MRSTLRLCALTLMVALPIAGCGDCGSVPDTDGDAGVVGDGDGDTLVICGLDSDCAEGWLCVGGVCQKEDEPDGGAPPVDDAGNPLPDPEAQLTVLPDTQIEFGAQLLGVPVTRDLQLKNTGDADLTILAIILDQDGDEFAVTPSGTVSEVLGPDEVMLLQVSHTPADATPDEAELQILHDGPSNIATIDLFAEFKGNASFSVTDELATLEPSIDVLDFGEVETGVDHEATLWLRNVGASDSIVELLDLTITPPTAGFSFADEPDLPALLSAWNTGLCPGGDMGLCGAGADSCTDEICVDADGQPVAGLALPIVFHTTGLPGSATLTIELDEGDGPVQHDVALAGLPTQPELVVTPSAAAFGSVLVDGLTPAEITIQVSNVGLGPLLITRVELPTAAAFTVEPSSPIPTSMGHPPLSISTGEPALELTVTFTPTAAEGYADVLTLHTNDGDQALVPITLSGSGVVCQANAGVDPTTGECSCLPGFNTCGDACVADSPTTCGSSCTDCTAGTGAGTDATCAMGQCAYTCAERYFDLDGDLDDSGDMDWDGCEYLCPSPLSDGAIAACQSDPNLDCETCNGVDDDCDGERDEGLDPDSADMAGSNDGPCTNATDLGEVDATTNGATNNWNYSIYPAGDNDWFKITVHEGLDSPACIQEIPCIEGGSEHYRTDFSVTAPSGESFVLDVKVPNKNVGNYDTCTSDVTNLTAGPTVTHDWSRSSDLLDCALCFLDIYCYEGGYGCAFDDKQVYFVRVRAAPGTSSFSCEPYTLTVTTTALEP
jgi:hypothetical protein